MSAIQPIQGPGVPASPTGRCNSPAIRAGDYVFVSSQSSTDDDGRIGLTDAIVVLNHLFRGAGPLPAPYPQAGQDPTGDGLGCR